MDGLLAYSFDERYQTQLRSIKANVSERQIDKFKEAARELEADDSEKHFDERLKRVARGASPKKDSAPDSKK